MRVFVGMWLGFTIENRYRLTRKERNHRPRGKQDSYVIYAKKWLLFYKVRENVEVFDGKFYVL